MTSAINQIIMAYVKLGNRQALLDLIAHREGLARQMSDRSGFDFTAALDHLNVEIAAARGGLEQIEDGALKTFGAGQAEPPE
ncbi:hypothetical protein [Tardiphaga sp.]|uniref:hypothetical protein n=1 Tax=Tardiphaga sp. TaxID=1926292 RepID=UPI00262AE250|nr:hypothetical protein [Tardiphaga sp.]MDB5616610.1 hypothetical protein [Tardiphaga sp.]